ncbi:MAG: bifunctional hydroxymethylpyrimidine kinase/phosphomethylpyrimidine kinase [Methanomicrobium sp.]|nr:bifunctional hydroxymethylpyrimidine kinase/phosphomethylpyrimidine kinase [Methanomicrobium sp.]MBQ3718775.1 bifunctional hydroxymethylpyrimidine kinase/phosphomethylpyrimidine kinase [Methanomicrobium sp.]
MPCACTIAGSDSGGGAGIQADLKTFAAFDVWGCSVITSLTAQNPCTVLGIENASADFVGLQMKAVAGDFKIAAYKTGMLPTEDIIRTVAANLPRNVPTVIDPVMISTSGSRLTDEDAGETLRTKLLPLAKIVTPNIPETCELSGIDLGRNPSETEIANAAEVILGSGAEYVLIKGGHLSGDCSSDYLISKTRGGGDEEVSAGITDGSRCRIEIKTDINGLNIVKYTGPRFRGDIHGSGCCLSSAIAACLAKGYTAEKACACAKVFIGDAIAGAYISESKRYSINPEHPKKSL